MNDFQEMWNHLKIIGSEATIILNLRPTRRSVFKTLAGHKKSQLKIESVRKFEKGNKIVWFSSYGSNVQSSRTANSKRATTRNVETVPIPHRPSERRSVPGGGGGEVKNDLRFGGRGRVKCTNVPFRTVFPMEDGENPLLVNPLIELSAFSIVISFWSMVKKKRIQCLSCAPCDFNT